MSRYGEFDPQLVQQELFDHEFVIEGWFDETLINPLSTVTYGGILKVWTGASWIKKKLYEYNGASFVQKPLKMWNGSEWALIDIY
jgi:hypothetical protein